MIRTNLQLNVSMKVNCVRKREMKLQGIGPRASHAGPVRNPMMIGAKPMTSEQSTPI